MNNPLQAGKYTFNATVVKFNPDALEGMFGHELTIKLAQPKQILFYPFTEMQPQEKYERLVELAEAHDGHLDLAGIDVWYSEDGYFHVDWEEDWGNFEMVIRDGRDGEFTLYCIHDRSYATANLDPILTDTLELAEKKYGSKRGLLRMKGCVDTKPLTAKEKYEKITRYVEKHGEDGQLTIDDWTFDYAERGEFVRWGTDKNIEYFDMSIIFKETTGGWNGILIFKDTDMKYFDPIFDDALKALEEKFGDVDAEKCCDHKDCNFTFCPHCGKSLK